MRMNTGISRIEGGEAQERGREGRLTVQVPDKRIPQLVMFDVKFQPDGYQQLWSVRIFQRDLPWPKSKNPQAVRIRVQGNQM